MTGPRLKMQARKTTGDRGRKAIKEGKRPSVAEQEEAAKKLKEDLEEMEKRKWVDTLKSRGFIVERQVDRKSLGTHPVIKAVGDQGLHFFFDRIKGYRRGVVIDFYSNMCAYSRDLVIESQIGTKTVTVTPGSIAQYLGEYQQPEPSSITFPKSDGAKLDKKTLEETLTDDPKSVKKGQFVSGKLRNVYRAINKVVHYNLHPHGSEKKPSARDGEILYVFGKDDEKVDWAEWIWGEMKNFREKGTQSGNIPFPVMVTKLCADAEVEPEAGDVLITTGFTKAITGSSLTKSKKMSKPPKAATIATSRPMGTRPSERIEEWMEIISNQYTIIQEGQARIETQLSKLRKEDEGGESEENEEGGESEEDEEDDGEDEEDE